MKENEYLIHKNRILITVVRRLLHDVLPESDYGIDKNEFIKAINILSNIEDELFKMVTIDGEE